MALHISDSAAFRSQISKSARQLVVVDFSATWCGPCRYLAPIFDELARKYPDVVFVKVLENEMPTEIQAQRIRGFPTIKFFFGGQQVHEIVGADAKGIEEAVKRLSAPQAT